MNVSMATAKLFLQGDEEATVEVYRRYRSLLLFIIATYVKSKEDCEDVYQNTFVKILEKRQSVQKPEALHSYLCSSAKNEAIDFAKKGALYVALDDSFDEAVGQEVTALDYFLPYDLTRLEKTVVGYKIAFGFSHKEIGELLGMSVPSVKSRYQQAMKKIKGAYRK